MHGSRLPALKVGAIFQGPTIQNETQRTNKKSDISESRPVRASVSTQDGAQDFSFRRLAEALFPKKTPAHLEYLTGESRGTWYDRLQNDRDPPSGSLVRLLRSTEGDRFYAHVMRGCTAEHWKRHQLAEIVLDAQEAASAAIRQRAEQLELGI